MKRPLTSLNTLWIFLLSLALGIIIWADGVRESDPLETVQYTIPIEVVRKPSFVVLNELPDEVLINVQIPSTLKDEINPSIFDAVIDLSAVEEIGTSSVPINVQFAEDVYERVSVTSHFPDSATLEMDLEVEKTIPVIVDVRGSAAEGFALGEEVADPANVTISGPSSRVNPVIEARTDVFLDIPRDTVTRNRPLSFYDSAGKQVSLNTPPTINASNTSAQVTIPVDELPGFRTVVVLDNTVGNVDENYVLDGVDIEPRTITVNGPEELLAELTFVETDEISIEGLRNSQSYNVGVKLPEGVTQVEQVAIEVDVSVAAIIDTRAFDITPQLVGLDESEFEAKLSQSTINVVLSGPRETLSELTDEEFVASLDFSGLESGIHELTVDITVPIQGVEVNSLQPALLVIELVALNPTPTPTLSPTPTNTPLPTRTLRPTITPTPEAPEDEA